MAHDLLQVFLSEAAELVDVLEQGLVGLEGGDGDEKEIVDALFRAAHTLKGNAGMLGLSGYVAFTHVLENVLAEVRSGTQKATREVINTLLSAVDVLRAMLPAVIEETPENEVDGYAQSLSALMESLSEGPTTRKMPRAVEMLGGGLRDLKLRLSLDCAPDQRKEAVAAIESDLDMLGTIKSVAPAWGSGAGEYTIVLTTDARWADIEAAVLFDGGAVELLTEPVAAPSPAPKAKKASGAGTSAPTQTLKIDSARLDAIVDLVGEMTIALARARTVQKDAGADATAKADAMEVLEMFAREVQERVMSLRMVSVRETFERFLRPIRDVARELGKEVAFTTEGADTEIDRKLLDALADPLKHMVRNAIAHGIETPAEREEAGKPRVGRLVLRALQRDGCAVVEIEDDGGGIDKERVCRKAVEKGLVSADTKLTDAQTYDLLFAAGFSTAEVVNEVAGRGVGLDVVKKYVSALHGTIQITSELGKGTTFRVRLPMTLAIVDGLNVQVGDETLAIPMLSVVEVLDTRTHRVMTIEGKNEYLDVRGRSVPVVRMGEVLDLRQTQSRDSMVVVLRNDDRQFGVVVDSVLGMSRAVLKPLERAYSLLGKLDKSFVRPTGLSGATVLGDGSVGLVVDVPGFEAMAFGA